MAKGDDLTVNHDFDMSMLAIIPARGGSKRIPRKNIIPFLGKPMIFYAIDAAVQSGLFDEIMVSTEDEEIASVAGKCGAVVPFMRKSETAGDFVGIDDVIKDVLDSYKQYGREYDSFGVIFPCVPLLTGSRLQVAGEAFLNGKAEMMFSAVKYAHPIQRGVVISESGFAEFRDPKNYAKRTQDLEPVYHDAGMFYFCRTESFKRHGTLRVPRMSIFELEEMDAQDIDTMDDLRFAELKLEMRRRMGGDQ